MNQGGGQIAAQIATPANLIEAARILSDVVGQDQRVAFRFGLLAELLQAGQVAQPDGVLQLRDAVFAFGQQRFKLGFNRGNTLSRSIDLIVERSELFDECGTFGRGALFFR